MTTIAYKNGVLAGDRRAVANGWIMPGTLTKVFKGEADGVEFLLGLVGYPEEAMVVVNTLLQNGQPPESFELSDGCRVIMIRGHSSDITVFEGKATFTLKMTGDFFAFGSGGPVALGALHAGASAKQAVVIASVYDGNTGSDVDTVQFGK